MNMVGAKVKARFGENVLVGVVKPCVDPDIVVLDIGEPSQVRYLLLSDGWFVNVLEPAEPQRGSVVLDRSDDAWQHRSNGWYMANGDDPYTWRDLVESFGPVRIVHDPEWEVDDCDECC